MLLIKLSAQALGILYSIELNIVRELDLIIQRELTTKVSLDKPNTQTNYSQHSFKVLYLGKSMKNMITGTILQNLQKNKVSNSKTVKLIQVSAQKLVII